MNHNTKDNNESAKQNEQVRWVTHPLSLDKLRITTGHDKAAKAIVPIILDALKAHEKVIFAAGGESGTGKSEIAYLVGEILKKHGIPTVEWSFDNAYVTSPEEREEKRAEDYDNNVGLKEEVNEHRLKVLERECIAVRSLWPHVTHRITEDWQLASYTHM